MAANRGFLVVSVAIALCFLPTLGVPQSCSRDAPVGSVVVRLVGDDMDQDASVDVEIDGSAFPVQLGPDCHVTCDLQHPKPLEEISVSVHRPGYVAEEDRCRDAVGRDDGSCAGHIFIRFRKLWCVRVEWPRRDVDVVCSVKAGGATRFEVDGSAPFTTDPVSRQDWLDLKIEFLNGDYICPLPVRIDDLVLACANTRHYSEEFVRERTKKVKESSCGEWLGFLKFSKSHAFEPTSLTLSLVEPEP